MGTEWECKKCTLLNSDKAQVCKVCEAPKKVNLPVVNFSCIPKSSSNSNIAKQANVSAASNSKISKDLGMPNKIKNSYVFEIIVNQTKQWKCSSCTFAENNSSSATCEICQSPRPFVKVYNKCSLCGAQHKSTNSSFCYSCSLSQTLLTKNAKTSSGAAGSSCVHLSSHDYNKTKQFSKEVERIIHYCKTNGIKFVDDSFPPTDKSIFLTNQFSSTDQNYLNSFKLCKNIQWLRPSISGRPKPTDIEQGLLGNCWFLSALSVLAEKISLLENIFINQDISKEGIYQLKLCCEGDWVDVYIDDLLPCDENGKLLFSRVKRDQLWVPLIEKALAKVYGCYESLKAGRCIEGMSLLTGAPCESLSFTDCSPKNKEKYDLLWVKLLSSKESGFLMGASCGNQNNVTDDRLNFKIYESVGLVSQHAYSILDVREFDELRIIKFHNPWGKLSWGLGCADYSQEDLKKLELFKKNESPNNGVFWMTYDNVLKYFQSIDICKHSYEWLDYRISGDMPTLMVPLSVVDVFVSSSQELEIGLFLKEKRRQKSKESIQVDLFVGMYKIKDSSCSSVGPLVESSLRRIGGFIGFNSFLQQGWYRVVCASFGHLDTNFTFKYTLTMHCSKPVEYKITNQPADILAECIIELCKNKGEYHQLHSNVHACLLKEEWCGFIATVFNLSRNSGIYIMSDLSGSSNIKSTRYSLTTYDIIPPRHGMVVSLLTQMDVNCPIIVKWRTSCMECLPGTKLSDFIHSLPDELHFPNIENNLRAIHRPKFILNY